MTLTGFTKVSDRFTVGAAVVPPTAAALDADDGHEYWQTSDGTVNGTVLAVWRYEGATDVWMQQPLGGTTCPDPMTRAALLAMRNSGSLMKDCHYVITDYNRGTVGAATILLHAVDNSTLGMEAKVLTAFDTLAWSGRYDIDSGRLVELSDNVGNVVYSQDSVDVFPWGVAAVTNNTVRERATLVYTAGTVTGNTIGSNANITMTSGRMIRNNFEADSNVTLTAGDIIESRVGGDATLTVNTTGDVDNCTFAGLSVVNVSDTANVDASHFKAQSRLTASGAANIDNLEMGESAQATVSGGVVARTLVGTDSTLTVSAGTTYDNTVAGNSTLTVTGGSVYKNTVSTESSMTVGGATVYENEIGTSSVVNLVGQRNFYRNTVANESSLTVGAHLVFESNFSRASVNTTGATGSGIRYTRMHRVLVLARNVPILYWQSCSMDGYTEIRADSAAECQLNGVNMASYGRVLVSAGARLRMTYSGLRDYGYVQVTRGFLTCDYSTVTGVSYIQNASTGTNAVQRCTVSDNSRIRFLGTSTNCRAYYCQANSGSFIEHRGTSTGCYFYYCEVTSASGAYSNNSVNMRAYYNTVSGNSELYSSSVTGTHYLYYNNCSGHGYIRFENAPGGYIYAVSCTGQALLRFRPASAAGRIFYSSFTAYYYLYANAWTVTRTGLHGYGRQTYTVTNPATNGTPLRNF